MQVGLSIYVPFLFDSIFVYKHNNMSVTHAFTCLYSSRRHSVINHCDIDINFVLVNLFTVLNILHFW